MALTTPTFTGGRHGYALIYHNPRKLVNPTLCPGAATRGPVMTGDREQTASRRTDPGEDRADDSDVEIHEAIVARERAGCSFPDGDALAAMEEPLQLLTSATVLFSDVTAERTEGPELRIQLPSTGGPDQ